MANNLPWTSYVLKWRGGLYSVRSKRMGRTRWGVMGTLSRSSPYSNSGSRGCHVSGLHPLQAVAYIRFRPLGTDEYSAKSLESVAVGEGGSPVALSASQESLTRHDPHPGQICPFRCPRCYQLRQASRRLTQSWLRGLGLVGRSVNFSHG